MAWDRVCKPKSHGGLGLRDPRIINRVIGTKIWWRWLKEIQAPWAKIWKHKYASEWQEENLIRMIGHDKGFAIWNRAWENRAKTIVSGRSEMGTWLGSGRTIGNRRIISEVKN